MSGLMSFLRVNDPVKSNRKKPADKNREDDPGKKKKEGGKPDEVREQKK